MVWVYTDDLIETAMVLFEVDPPEVDDTSVEVFIVFVFVVVEVEAVAVPGWH